MNPTSSNTLLTYSLSTLPDPLQISPATGISYGSISIVASNNQNDPLLQLSSVTIILPVGTDAAYLTNDPAAITYSCSPSSVWNISRGVSDGEYVLSPVNGMPVTVTTEGIVIQFNSIPINSIVGTAEIEVNELAQGTAKPRQLRQALFDVAKFPYGFYFGNLMSSSPMVPDNGTVTLTWVGSTMSTYTMKWDNNTRDVSEMRSWTSPALNNTTTFQVIATSVSQGETVNTSQSITVIVDKPELNATSLVVSGITHLQGETTTAGMTVNGQSVFNSPARFQNQVTMTQALNGSSGSFDSLTVNSSLNGSGGSFSSLGVTNVLTGGSGSFNSLGVTNAVTAGSGSFNSVGVNNTLTATAANINNLNVTGLLTVSNAMSALGWIRYMQAGTYIALTDGFAIAYGSSGGHKPGSSICGWVTLSIPAAGTFYAYGGNSKFPGGDYNDSSMLTFPIRKGESFSFGVQNSKGKIYTYYYFIPMGLTGSAFSGPAAIRTGDELPVVLPQAPASVDTEQLAEDLLNAIQSGEKSAIVAVLEKLKR